MIDPLPDSISDFKNSPKSKIKKISRPLEDLLLEMSLKDDDRKTAAKAFNEIIDRFESYLSLVGRNALYRNGTYDTTDLKSLVSNTLLFLYYNAENLLHIETLENESKKEILIKSWLSTVARREAAKINGALDDYFDKVRLTDFGERYKVPGANDDIEDEPVSEKIKIATYDDDGECLSSEEIKLEIDNEAEESLSSEEMIVLTEVLNECTEREKVIIRTYYDYLDGRRHLPADQVKRLCNEFLILPDNLNHIKDRTFKKIKQKSLERMRIKNPDYRLRE